MANAVNKEESDLRVAKNEDESFSWLSYLEPGPIDLYSADFQTFRPPFDEDLATYRYTIEIEAVYEASDYYLCVFSLAASAEEKFEERSDFEESNGKLFEAKAEFAVPLKKKKKRVSKKNLDNVLHSVGITLVWSSFREFFFDVIRRSPFSPPSLPNYPVTIGMSYNIEKIDQL